MIDPWPHPACLPLESLREQCEVHRGRSSGPGGQHRNKVETLVQLRHLPSGIHAAAGERRSQAQNARVALFRLRLELATHLRCPVPVIRGLALLDGPLGSRLWESRRRGNTIRCNPAHADFPALLAEALDVAVHMNDDPRRAAEFRDVTLSQFIKLVKLHPPALVEWNRRRADRGLHTLH